MRRDPWVGVALIRTTIFAVSFSLLACGSNPVGSDAGADVVSSDTIVDVGSDAPLDASDGAVTAGLWVDPVLGSDASSGTKASPLKTIKKAFTLAKSGDTVNLLPGTFGSSNGDDFSTPIPDGIALLGTTPNGVFEVTLEGTSSSALTFAGSGGVSSVWLKGFGTALIATSGTQTIDMVAWDGGGPVVSGSAQMTITEFTGFNGAGIGSVSNTAKLTMNNGTFGDVTGTATCADTATLSATNIKINSVTSAFAFGGSCTATISSGQVNAVATAFAITGTPTVTLDTVDVTGGAPVVGATGGTVSIKNGTFNASGSGTVSAITLSNATITINGLTIKNSNRFAIEHTSGSVDATGLTVTNCLQGGIYSGATFKLRSSTIKNNSLRGMQGVGSAAWDLGTTADHGNNTFLNNNLTNVDISSLAGQTVNASGNTWNASTQSSDGFGHYGTGATSGYSANGGNFITSSTAQLSLGP